MLRQLASFVAVDSQRLEVSGADLDLNARAAQAIGLALHELATNAVKYGALSVPTGKVLVSWTIDDKTAGEPIVTMRWLEVGGPALAAPSRVGFGSEVTTRIAPASISGTAKLEFLSTGLRYTLEAPLSALSVESNQSIIGHF